VNVLVTFIVVVFALAVRWTRKGKPLRRWPIMVGATLLCLTFLSLRVVQP
jgi:hypothetical protein